ncbi:MAG: SurA N-terminal domain-containing protein [Bacteroidales bacterium]|nr:SurA N-terminal domain-containing protein [Bacteroidales bacterium]
MAILQKTREKFGVVISIIIALALLSFIIDPSTLESALQSMSSKYDVGKIAGKSVSYQDFLEDVDRYTTVNEIMTGSSAQNEQQQQQIRNAAWQERLDKHMFLKNAKAAGLNVGEAEMLALTTGDMVSPIIAQNPYFADEKGMFSSDKLVEFVQQMPSDQSGQMKAYWNYIQNTVYTQQFYAKYGSLFTSSAIQNPLMLRKAIEENNVTSDVDFVMVPFGYGQDSTIVVSPKEISNYYKAHKDFYKQQAGRDIEYVVFEVEPSAQDIAAANEKMAEAYNEFAEASNIKSFLLKNSDRPLSDYWYKDGELSSISSDVNAFAFGKASGVSPIFTDENSFFAAKVIDSAMLPDSVYVKHILLQGDNARHTADSLAGVIAKGGNFASAAAVYSADQGSAADGELGNIGWMTQSYMIPGFESVITAEIGKPYVIDTQYGSHVVLVSKKTRPVLKKKVAILEKTALASKETFNEFYAKANRFATLAGGTYEGYKKAVDSLGVYSHPMNNVREGNARYGSVDQAKEVTRWIYDAKKGKASNIITVNNNYFFIAALKEIHEEGYASVKEVSPSIRQTLYSQKLGEKKTAEVAEKIAGLTDLQAIAEALGTTVSSHSDIAFSSMGNPGLDPAFIGAVSVAEPDKICGPVAGGIGVYVFKVTGRDTGAFFTEDDAKNFEAQKMQYNSQMIIPVMMEEADVVDHRDRFF